MLCPACGAPAPAGDRFCRRCGSALPPAAPAAGAGAAAPAPPPLPPLPPTLPLSGDPRPLRALPPPRGYPYPHASAPPRRRHALAGSSLALLIIALVLLLGATNPSPAAYVSWAAARLVPQTGVFPFRNAAYVAVERGTVAADYGVCTVYRTRLDTADLTVVGILGRFVTIGERRIPGPATTPAPQRHGPRSSVQI